MGEMGMSESETQQEEQDEAVLVVVHGGAGRVSRLKEDALKKLLGSVCKKALRSRRSLEETLQETLGALEESPLTNAGVSGGALASDGQLYVDASVMDGRGSFGAIGACPAVRSTLDHRHWDALMRPSSLALSLLKEDTLGIGPLGRVPPLLVAGNGAWDAAKTRGLLSRHDESPVSQSSIDRFKKHSEWLSKVSQMSVDQQAKELAEDYQVPVQDTVGVIVMNSRGRIMAGVSSAGMSLKDPGRIGAAAIFGSAVWAQDASNSRPGLGLAASGQGEQIIRTSIARCAAQRLGSPSDLSVSQVQSQITALIEQDFLSSPLLPDERHSSKDVGLVLVRKSHGEDAVADLWFAHSTPAFAMVRICMNIYLFEYLSLTLAM